MLEQNKTVVDVLLEMGKINQTQANGIFAQQLQTGKSLDEVVRDSGFVDRETVLQALSKLHNIPVVDLNSVGSSPASMALIDQELARRYKMIPFSFDIANGRISVAMANPLDLNAIQFVSQKTGKTIVPYYADADEITQRIEIAYSDTLSQDVTEALEETDNVVKAKAVQNFSELNTGSIIKQAPIAKIVEQILGFAVGSNASDVHIEPQTNRIRVRYRIDGILQEKLVLPRSVAEDLVSRIKILSRLKIDEKRLPQDGRFNFSSDKGEVDLRVSTLPTVHGEKVVIRLLRKQTHIATMEELGMSGEGLQEFLRVLKLPQGIVLVTGPTGSGKTTTLYSALNIVNKTAVNILTVEDPVEYEIAGISQVQVNNQAGLTFASVLRSFLRQDPDIMMVGEIRDQETAALAVQASLTGHLVFATLHTNSASGAIPRLVDMGIEPFLLASSINLVMAQRVLRKLNPNNSQEYAPSAAEIAELRKVLGIHFDNFLRERNITVEQLRLRRPLPEYENSSDAYKGRIAIFEVMPMDTQMQEMVAQNKTANELEAAALEKGMLLMKQDGYLKVLNGITTIEEVLRVAQI
ncbi:MAG: GspE/PulE family protein [bacterium]|nr:GspE/PulE family protein [bacterium]